MIITTGTWGLRGLSTGSPLWLLYRIEVLTQFQYCIDHVTRFFVFIHEEGSNVLYNCPPRK